MLRMGTLCGALACLLACVPLRAADVALPPAAKTKIEFARDIEPLLAKRCLSCHGAQQQMSGLRLDQKESRAQGRCRRCGHRPRQERREPPHPPGGGHRIKKFMPPMGAHLTAEEVGLLRAWIDQGVEWTARAPHWSFQKIQRPAVPAVRDRAWARNAVDNFILRAAGTRRSITPVARSVEDSPCSAASASILPAFPPRPKRFAITSMTTAPTPMNAWSTGCSIRRTTARSGRATGSTWRATPIATATKRTARAPGPGAIATG